MRLSILAAVAAAIHPLLASADFAGISLPTVDSVTSSTSWDDNAQAAWDKFVADTVEMYASEGIQADCMPKQWKADDGVAYKGTIMLLHGFTACPQQYFETHAHLTALGYNVLAPLLPGHGLEFKWVPVYENAGPWWNPWSVKKLSTWKGEDKVDRLARDNNEFKAYVDRLNAVMKEVPGDRIVTGLSLGGAVAMLTGATYVDSTNSPLYTRQLISVPLMDFSDSILSGILYAASRFTWTSNILQGWGDGCEVERRAGRAGICAFRMGQVYQAKEIGAETLALLKATDKTSTFTQIVYVEGDLAVSNPLVRDLYDTYSGSKSKCVMDKAVGHSFMSRYDNPTENKYWLYEAHQRVASWLAQAVGSWDTRIPSTPTTGVFDADGFIVQDGVNANEENDPRCAQDCTASSCKYGWSCADDSTCGSQPPVRRERKLGTIRSATKPFPDAEEIITHKAHREMSGVTSEMNVKKAVVEDMFPETKRKLASEGASALWTNHVLSWMSGPHQEGCLPLQIPAKGTPSSPKGVVILLHGFSSCPKDLEEWGNAIASEGYEVLLPLLPGHGREFLTFEGEIFDDYSSLPRSTVGGLKNYTDFTDSINEIADAFMKDGFEVSIGGLSLGASLAHIAASEGGPSYDSVLLASPFYGLADTDEAAAFLSMTNQDVSSAFGDVATAETGWDSTTEFASATGACEVERQQGRAGYCKFTVDSVNAAIEVGNLAKERGLEGPRVQIVAAANDPFASNDLTKEVAESAKAKYCAYDGSASGDGPANHALASTMSAPWERKWWLESFMAHSAKFVSEGDAFEEEDGVCESKVEPKTFLDQIEDGDKAVMGLAVAAFVGVIGLAVFVGVKVGSNKQEPLAKQGATNHNAL